MPSLEKFSLEDFRTTCKSPSLENTSTISEKSKIVWYFKIKEQGNLEDSAL